MTRQPEAVAELRRAIGGALKAYREASPLNQSDLARATHYDRTSISHIEAGRQFPEREFWEAADKALAANGALVARYDNVCGQEERLVQAELARELAERQARTERAAPGSSPSAASPGRLFRDYRHPIGFQADRVAPPIDDGYITGLRADIKRLVQMDQRYGGNETSSLILRAFRQIRKRMDSSEIRKGLNRDIHAVAAEVAEVAGWSLYDADEHEKAERINNESIKLSRLAGERGMELFVLQNMSMQASHLGRARESLNIARLVLEGDPLSPRLQALFRIREARALARLKAEREARLQFSRARSLFLDGVREDDPAWAWWVDENELAWHEGMIELYLGKLHDCVEFFQSSADGIPSHRVRTSYNHRTSALMAHVLNESWVDAEDLMRSLLNHVGFVGSRRTDRLLEVVLRRIDRADATDTVRDLASALRVSLANAA